MLGLQGYACDEADDPYTAMAELCRQPGAYVAVILSLTGIYKEELAVIRTIKTRFPQMDVWLAQTDGRHGAMIEAIGLGADGLLSNDGLHLIGMPAGMSEPALAAGTVASIKRNGQRTGDSSLVDAMPDVKRPGSNGSGHHNGTPVRSTYQQDLDAATEPVLSAEELRALLEEQPILPPHLEH